MSTENQQQFDWRELVKNMISARIQQPVGGRTRELWSVVGQMLCVGSGTANRICQELGFDPSKQVKG